MLKSLQLCALIAVFLFLLLGCNEQENVDMPEPFTTYISAPAELVSLQDVMLSPPSIPRTWEYKIKYLAKENTIVKAGDKLIEFDDQRLQTQLLERKSALDGRRKEQEQDRLNNIAKYEELVLSAAEAKKNRDIAARKVEITDVSRAEIERKKQQAEFTITSALYQQAKKRIEQHKLVMNVSAQVQKARVDKALNYVEQISKSIEKMTIFAPVDGMVSLIPNHDGDRPAVGDTVYMGSRLMSLPSLDHIAVKIEFDESNSANVKIGDPVSITFDAYAEKLFTGSIKKLGRAYRQKSKNNRRVVFDAWVNLDNTDASIMRPGMKGTVELVEKSDV